MTNLLEIAANNVITNSLRVQECQEVAIVCEEDNLEIAKYLSYATLKQKATPVVIPIFKESRQILKGLDMGLKDIFKDSQSLECLLNTAQIIIVLTHRRADEFKFREHLLDYIRNGRCRIAHLPGINTQQFKQYLSGDIEDLEQKSFHFLNILSNNTDKAFYIKTEKGTNISLEITNKIRLNSGIIDRPGMMENLPGGEVYFVVKKNSVNGNIIVDLPIENGNEKSLKHAVKIRVENGIGYIDEMPENFKSQFETHFNTKNGNILGEISVGLNDQIISPSGTSVIDEKMKGAVHFTFGDNISSGGDIQSDSCLSIGVEATSIYIEESLALRNGDFV